MIWKEGGGILGFITVQKKGAIPLIGVAQSARGRGIGKKLIQSALSLCDEWHVSEISVDTQIANIPAQRLYQSSGFMVHASYFTFRWYRSDENTA